MHVSVSITCQKITHYIAYYIKYYIYVYIYICMYVYITHIALLLVASLLVRRYVCSNVVCFVLASSALCYSPVHQEVAVVFASACAGV